MSPSGAMAKRVIDFLVAALALALIWPFFVIIAALIKLDSKGPVFFRQERDARAEGYARAEGC